MDRRSVLALLSALTIACDASPRVNAQCADGAPGDNNLWVKKVLDRMQSIKPGMTRKDLLTVFTPEGGLSEVDKRTYRSQDCIYFAVDVGFRLRHPSAPLPEDPQDQILTISQPYLKLSFVVD
jgi:hypothetical protein